MLTAGHAYGDVVAMEKGPERTKRLIVQAAAECFGSYSLQRTSMEDVAEASGLSRPTIYRHFRRKEELIQAVAEKKAQDVTDAVAKDVPDDLDPWSRISGAIVRSVEYLVVDRQMREMVEGDYRAMMERKKHPAIIRITTDRLLPILNEAVSRGIIAKTRDLAELIVWITDLEILLAMRTIVLGGDLAGIRRDVEAYVMPGLCDGRR